MRTARRHILLFCFISLSCMGCRKELCYDHDRHSLAVKVMVQPSWMLEWEIPYSHDWKNEWDDGCGCSYEDLRPEPADGVRAVLYENGKNYAESNIPASGGRIPLKEGISSVIFYNNDTEYIVFNETGSMEEAAATTRTVTRGGFKAMHKDERTMNQPDMLYGHYKGDYPAEKTLQQIELPVMMHPLTYTYLIHYRFAKGIGHVALARGAIAGMAEKVYLKDGHTGNEASTILFECTADGINKEKGFVEAIVKTFGAPNYPENSTARTDGTDTGFTLNLEVRMHNGRFKNFEFDITEQMLGQPRGGVIVVEGLEISDEEGGGSGGGFDADVEGWGDYIDIPLPID